MTGNADEFCSDWYDGNYYSVSPYNNPTGPDNGTYPVIRGANWDSAGNNRCRLAYRAWISSRNARGGDNGFRVARDEPPCWREQEKLLASDGVSNAGFGHSVSVSGDYAIVGAYGDDDNGTYSGSAYIFKWDGTSWIEQQKLLASDGAAHDHFGHSVFVSGDYAIVGAVFDDDDDNGTNSGSVYIFKRDGTVWSEQVKLIASDGADGDFFGYSISICGDYAIVGACLDDDNGTYSGSAYIFKKSDTSGDPNWYEEAKLTASDGAADDRFGRGVSVSGDYAIVGAYWNDDNGSKSGSAYIFKKSDTPGDPNWYEQDKLTASDAAAGDEFGIGVSVSGDYAIVGAVFNDDNGAESGSAYIFKRDGMVWSEQVKLIASDGEDNDNFGYSVSVSGDYAIVGAYGDDSRTGSAYIFKCDGTVWGEQVKLIASDDAAYDLFGTSVSISGYYAIVGAYGNDDKGSSSGSAYVFDNICPELPCSGRIVAWGTDIEGQASPPAGNDFVAIAAGFYHGIALKSDGSIVGWGKNNYGQASPPVGNDFTAISTGGWHGIALKSDGSIVGWGVDDGSPYDYGQANPPAGNDFTAIAAGGYYNIALKSDGSIVGWGLDGSPYDYGQANPPAGNDFVAIAAGHAYSIALKCDGSIVGWGADWFGQANPPAGNDFTAISAGVYHNLALKKDGSIVGWGRNLEGQTTPPAGNDFVAVAAGDIHSLALKSDGSIVGWGDDSVGQASPPAGNNFTAIAAGDYHSLALTCEPEPSNSAPVAVCQDLTVVADSNCEGFVTAEDVNDGSFDPDGDSISFSIDPCGPYLLGETVVTLTVSDGVASDTCEATVTVVDTTAPVVIVGDMAAVWPANHKYREFKLSDLVVSVDDACGGLLDVDAVGTIVSIYSDEPEDAKGNGDGKTTDDIVILGASSFKVRSERAGGGNGRVYGVTFEVVDAAGNVSVGTCYVGVAHDQSGDGPVDDGAGAGYAVP